MVYAHPILGIVTYEPIASVFGGAAEANLIGLLLMNAIHLVSILIVCFLAGLLFPRDPWVVRVAVVVSVLWYIVEDIGAHIYVSRQVAHYPLSLTSLLPSLLPYIVVMVLAYLLSGSGHCLGSALRTPGRNRDPQRDS
jgi:fatty-acid desaturase